MSQQIPHELLIDVKRITKKGSHSRGLEAQLPSQKGVEVWGLSSRGAGVHGAQSTRMHGFLRALGTQGKSMFLNWRGV